MYKTILVPIDVTEDALTDLVIPHVEAIQKLNNANVHFLAVTAPISNYLRYGGTILPGDFPDDEKQAEIILNELKEKVKRFSLPADKIHVTSSVGSVKDEILAIAEEINADIILIGSRHPSMSTYLLGSNAASVVRYAKTSVLVIR
ncbi:universal stress protein [Providencia stuartii]|uniref:Universal stress protein n=1 Tax=Providencia stuartii TaxID=588 RepID=A0A1S1HWX1_PROST|nr:MULTISPECIES: universal stress protein [Providencia]MDV5225211.1 universal stress protein [Providencia rettgeri]ELR5114225.1 universal stress protein [Providencia stuartii]ELR5300461.1 universal stress protein [Providencia stuartii]MDW7588096.1 universal stress protein [Providencia sp. 2023EL-00965]OHT25866.1 universal stress protein [Providencia stuartii]